VTDTAGRERDPRESGASETFDETDADDHFEYSARGWIQEVANTPDTPLRSHRITLTYSKLARCLDLLIFGNGDSVEHRQFQNANWFHFATWGTYTLGPNIRNDSAPQRLDTLPAMLRRRVAPAIIHSRAADGDVVGRALAWGQRLIFISSASALNCFKEQAERGSLAPGVPFQTRPEAVEFLVDKVNGSGTRWIDAGHLKLIDKAFTGYALARRRALKIKEDSGDPSADTIICRLLLLGTILLTAVEQDVVNTALRTVVEAVPVRVMTTLEGRLASLLAARKGVRREVVALETFNRMADATNWLTEAWARLMTKQLLVIVLPTEILRLGKDVPPRDFTAPLYPLALDDLQVVKDPDGRDHLHLGLVDADEELTREWLTYLDQTVRTLDRTGADGTGSRAHDWRRFDDRLNWAICLFRSRQQDASLFWPPYSEEDERRLHRGDLPRGRSLDPIGHGVVPPLDPGAIGEFLRKAATLGGGL
jgi:hypothetical protein